MAKKTEELKKKLKAREDQMKKELGQLRARIQLESAKERKIRDKRETHVKVIGGAIAFELAEQDPAIHKKVEDYLQGYLESRPGDWPYFDDFPKRKDGQLLFQLTEPRGWAEVKQGRKIKKTKTTAGKYEKEEKPIEA